MRFAHLPPLAWMQSLGRPGAPAPRRVLVAGCGTGAEAFELRRALPDADIVAVDFSPRSIAVARRLQRAAPRRRPIRFAVADLNDPRLVAETGGHFDLVTCHGVLTYLPGPQRALRNLAACTHPDGLLYLGVNGEAHPGDRVRRWLGGLGVDTLELRDERRLRAGLRLWDRLHPEAEIALADRPATFLAGDICGPQFNNWSLARWRHVAARAGWSLAATGATSTLLRRTLADAGHRLLYPSTLDELAVRLDLARPVSFHRLLLRRADAAAWDWDGTIPPGPCEVRWTGLYALRVRPASAGAPAWAVLTSITTELRLDWPLTLREAAAARELARAATGALAWPAGWPRTEEARRTLWLWAAFGVITVRPTAYEGGERAR